MEMSIMNKSKVSHWGAWLLVTLSAAGCAHNPYADVSQSGQSVRQAVKAQTLNPDAGQKNLPPPDTDGVAMKSAVDLYQSAFGKPPAPVNVLSIGLGGASGSSGR
jgi:hypothetical protein